MTKRPERRRGPALGLGLDGRRAAHTEPLAAGQLEPCAHVRRERAHAAHELAGGLLGVEPAVGRLDLRSRRHAVGRLLLRLRLLSSVSTSRSPPTPIRRSESDA